MRPRQPQHLRRFNYVGYHAYFLTFCTYERRAVFTSPGPVELVLAQISRAAGESFFAVLAYCFMADHVHLLVEGISEASDCKDFIKRAKQYSGFYFMKTYRARLWQRYSYDHVLRDHQKPVDAARYILGNPVHAALVTRPEDYPFSGSLTVAKPALFEWIHRQPT